MKKLNHIWILSDSIKGHEIQSYALASKLCPNISLFHCGLRQPWLSFAPRILPRFGHNIIWKNNQPDITAPPDVIITCGRRMAAVGKFYKRLCQCKHIQILNPGDNTKKYDVLVCPEHDRLRGSNVVTIQGSLHNYSVSSLNQQKQQCLKSPPIIKDKSIALLLGNPARGFYKELNKYVTQIKSYYPDHDLYVCGSRRTDKKHHEKIRQKFKWAQHIWLTDVDGKNPYVCLLACCELFVVTADSINMVSEACATDKSVVAIGQNFISPKHKRFIGSINNRLTVLGMPIEPMQPITTLNSIISRILNLLSFK